jgi:hypothetical protein
MSTLTLALVKEFLEIGHSKQDNVIQLLIDGAETFLENWLGVRFTSASRIEDLDGGGEYLLANLRPVTAVASVKDLWNGEAAMACRLVGDGRILRADATGRPLGEWTQGVRRYRATYTGGYASVPAPVKQAALQMVYRAYQARASEASNSVAGASTTWGALFDSDMMKMVMPFRRVRAVEL